MKSAIYVNRPKVRANSTFAAMPRNNHLASTHGSLRSGVLGLMLCFAAVALPAQQAYTPGNVITSRESTQADLSNVDVANLQQRAQAGDAEAQAELGDRYYKGQGVPRDYDQAETWINRAANQGNARAEQAFADLYWMGFGVATNDTQAYNWERRAAEQGRPVAQQVLAGWLRNGIGTCQDFVESASWARKAAEQGDVWATLGLAEDYEYGMGVPQDIPEARRWYEKVAGMGDVALANRATFMLKKLNALPPGVQSAQHVDVPAVGGCAVSSHTLWQRARAGDAEAKAEAARADEHGDLPTQRKAALGDPHAQQSLTDIYMDHKNYEQAAFWYRLISQYWGADDATGADGLVHIAVLQYQPHATSTADEIAALYRSSAAAAASGTDFRTMPGVQVLKMLENANGITVNIKGTNFTDRDRYDVEWGKACNGGKSKESGYGGENACFQAFTHYAKPALSDLTNTANLNYIMSALLRGCGLYAPSDDKAYRGRTCGLLGKTLYAIGNEEAARSVWELAPGCYSQDERSGTPMNGCIRVLTGEFGQFFKAENLHSYPSIAAAYRGEPQRLVRMLWQSCTSIHDRESCGYLQSYGATVDMAAVEQMERERHEGVEEYHAQMNAQFEREKADAEARRNALFSALAGMGGSNPTAILDAGNRQAAALRAIGNANAGYTGTVASPAASSGMQTIMTANSAASVPNSPNSSASPSNAGNSAPGADNTPTTHETCPNTQVYPDAGVSCNPVRSLMQCVNVVSSNWTGNASNQNFGSLTVVFANTCTQPIRLVVKGGEQSDNSGELTNVGAGQQYTFSDTQHNNLYFYSADDGTDCFANNSRPGCSSNQLLKAN